MNLSKMNKKKIVFYGATWCADCRRSKQYLDDQGITYEYINIDEDPKSAEKVVAINKGFQSIPTIVFPDGDILVEPSNAELQKAIDTNKQCIIAHKSTMQKGG